MRTALALNLVLCGLVACGDALSEGEGEVESLDPNAETSAGDAASNPRADAGKPTLDAAADSGRDAAEQPDASEEPDASEQPDASDAGTELDAADVPDVFVPDPAALLTSSLSGPNTSELGGAVTFEVHLTRAPLAPVTVPITSSDASEGSVAPALLTFTPEDWEAPRVITVTGVPDTLVDGPIAYQISIGASTSTDPGYHERYAPPVALTNLDHPLPAYQTVDVNHILSTGQSNAVANTSHPGPAGMTNVQPYGNISFDVGVMTAKTCNGNGCKAYEIPNGFVPLVEGDVFPLSATPRETMSSSMANEISFLGENVYFPGTNYVAHDSLVSLHGRSGNSYICLRLGTCTWYAGQGFIAPFEEGMQQVRDAKRLTTALGKSYAVRAVTTVHGESDHNGYATLYPMNGTNGAYQAVTSYADALIEWQKDYEREVTAITGQTLPIPLFTLQMSWAERAYNEVAVDQLRAHERAPGKVILVTPTYMLPYNGDCLHYAVESHRRIGEYFGKAYAHTVFTGQPWEPLRPLEITRNGNVVTVRYHVPVPPLVLDTAAVSNPGNYGFRYLDDTGAITISAVAIAGDTVQITLSGVPAAANRRIEYAVSKTGAPGCAGPITGLRGNLRDSDATQSQRGAAALVNWSVGFRMAVP